MFNGSFSPPKNLGIHASLGDISFNDWLSQQPQTIQNQVTDAQIANPSDYVPYDTVGTGKTSAWLIAAGIALLGITLIKVGK